LLHASYPAKIWLTVCVAVMMSFATVTPDIHPVEPDEIACQDEGSAVKAASQHNPMIIMLTIVVVVTFMQRRFILRPLNPLSQIRSDII